MIGIDRQPAISEKNNAKTRTGRQHARMAEPLPFQLSWISALAGVKYDGTILGQEPPRNSLKELDFNGLLYEEPETEQQSRAAGRCAAQPAWTGK